jgi:CubicO group peptidase (beta-lactamase class C family)
MRRDYKTLVIIALCVSTIIFINNFDQIFQEEEYYSPLISTSPQEQGMNSTEFSKMYDYIEQNNIDLHSVMILRNGFVVNETYLEDSKIRDEKKFLSNWLIDEDLHNIFSATKSITSLLIGIAIDHGYINNVNQTFFDFFPELLDSINDDSKSQITIEHLLTMTSGIPEEVEENSDNVQDILNSRLLCEPGEEFYYSSSASHLLTAIIDRSTEMKVEDFAEEFLFKPIGISRDNWTWEDDRDKINIGGWGIFMTPRAMARIGLLCLNNGKWNETQVISADWIEKSTTSEIEDAYYGYLWWIEPNCYVAAGMYGQCIFIYPVEKLVVVFTGLILDFYGIYLNLIQNFILQAIFQ